MSTQTITTYDVFLSYPATERGLADQIARSLTQSGLDVFWADEGVVPGEEVRDTLWRALAESAALIAIVSSEGPLAPNTAVEVGTFKAWCKPIYVVRAARGNIKLPTYLADCPVYPLSRIDDVVASIKRGLASLSKTDCDELAVIYRELGIPTDRLITDPVAIERLADEFNAKCGKRVPGERLVQELLRMRKGGGLPRLPR